MYLLGDSKSLWQRLTATGVFVKTHSPGLKWPFAQVGIIQRTVEHCVLSFQELLSRNKTKQQPKKGIFFRILLIPKNTSDPVNPCSVCLRLCCLYALAFVCVLALLLGGAVLGLTLIPCLMEGCCVLCRAAEELVIGSDTYLF